MSSVRAVSLPGSEATVEVLFRGYIRSRVASTVSYVHEGRFRAVVDPGMVPSPVSILGPLAKKGVRPDQVTDVILSHHHPDHTINCALFPNAKVHDFWATYDRDRWTSRPAEGLRLATSVVLLETPGHTPQDITTLVGTPKGVVALTHLWWNVRGPTPDPYASDERELERQRRRVGTVAGTVIPGHGAPFRLRSRLD
ncbi:MAG: MBL fold metallo-hydrolase [Thermoplasmata archaeon]|jgi:glyoxylase-like metal-dependent hydrolase (beta-lactamase superfamily II)